LLVWGFWWIETSTAPGADLTTPHKLIVSNHIGYIEIFYLVSKFAPSFVAKRSVLDIPLFGSIAAAMQSIFVDRSSEDSRHKTGEMLHLRADPNSTFPPCAIFPEGTATNGTTVITMAKGAFRDGHPMRVFAVYAPVTCGFDPSWGVHSDDGGDDSHLLGLMMQPLNRLRVHDLGVFKPNSAEKADPQAYVTRVQRAIAESIGAEISPCTLSEFLAEEDRRKGRPVKERRDEEKS